MKTVNLEIITYKLSSFWNLLRITRYQGVAVRLNEKWAVCLEDSGLLKYKRYESLKDKISTHKKIDNKQWKVLNGWLADAVEREIEFKDAREFLALISKVIS